MNEDILIKFFIIITTLFFIPKVIRRFYKIPSPITEVVLGILLGILLPQYFFLDDMLSILGTLGIIILFVYSGMEVDTSFIFKNKKFFIENILLSIFIFLIVGFAINMFLHLNFQIAFLISLALTTPSASFIISSLSKENEKLNRWITGKAIIGELSALLLMIILLKISNTTSLIIALTIVLTLIIILPIILKFLYQKIFSKLIGMEFSFIFVVAIISAFATEFVGVHFLVGAFIAGMVSRRFLTTISEDKKSKLAFDINNNVTEKITESFGFFTIVFAPFYFFTIGLKLNMDVFTLNNILIAGTLCFSIVILRVLLMLLHRMARMDENLFNSLRISATVIPTLVFSFVIAEILLNQFNISQNTYYILMLYGVFSAGLSLLIRAVLPRPKKSI